MITKKHIKAKRQYVSPSIYVKVLQMESMLAGESAWATGGDFEGEGGNSKSKRVFAIENDELEEYLSE